MILSAKLVDAHDVARLISVALNRRIAVAMKISPLEIWSALRSLCKPDPMERRGGGVAFGQWSAWPMERRGGGVAFGHFPLAGLAQSFPMLP